MKEKIKKSRTWYRIVERWYIQICIVERCKDQIQQKRVLTSLRSPTGHLNREPLRVHIHRVFFKIETKLVLNYYLTLKKTYFFNRNSNTQAILESTAVRSPKGARSQNCVMSCFNLSVSRLDCCIIALWYRTFGHPEGMPSTATPRKKSTIPI